MKHRFKKQTVIPVSAEAVFQWHERPGAFNRLSPPWEKVRVVHHSGGIRDGAKVRIQLSMMGLRLGWDIRHEHYQFARQFVDYQVKGPFSFWRHTHRFMPNGNGASVLEDAIEYQLPKLPFADWFGQPIVSKKLARMFAYRHRVTQNDLSLLEKYKGDSAMKIAVSGASGLVGSALVAFLTTQGHSVFKLVRRPTAKADEIYWNPEKCEIESEKLEDMDAVVHLAGDNIAQGRWTPEKKARILSSRVDGTLLLAGALARLQRKPKVMVCASATGFYGSRGEERLTELNPKGRGFLADVCEEWENAAQVAASAGIRIVHNRFGIILSAQGGALPKMLPPFLFGAGGNLGSGKQYMSWIALDDVIGAIYHSLYTESLSGPVNTVSPQPVRNSEFTKTLGRVLKRPTIAPVPALGVRLLFGEMGDELLLASARVEPQKLTESGYQFLFPDLESALRHVLGKERAASQSAA